jgi:hypothetical protein
MVGRRARKTAIAIAGVLAVVGLTGAAGAVDGMTEAQAQARTTPGVTVMANGGGPLTGVTVSSGAIMCTEGPIAVASNGRLGFLAPRMAPNILRGSSDQGPTVWWDVVSFDDAPGNRANIVSTCRVAQ